MDKPRLLIVSQSYVPAENQKKLYALANHFELICVTPQECVCVDLHYRLIDSPAPVTFKLIGLKTVGNPLSTTKYIYRGLAEIFREHRVDVILVESEPWALVRWQAWLLKRLYQPGALFGEYAAENVERRGIKQSILHRVYKAAVATADFVIAINEPGGDLFRRRQIREDRLLISPQLGVDEALFKPVGSEQRSMLRTKYGCSQTGIVIGFCGRYVPEKGISELVTALDEVRTHKDFEAVELALLGSGPLRDMLLAKQQSRPWLKILPPCDFSEVAFFMQMLDLFILPSKPRIEGGQVTEEQLGHVLLEAMACGVPALGSNSGEVPTVIGDSEAVFPYDNPSLLALRIIETFRNPGRLESLALQQRKRVLNRYTNLVLGQRWSDFIKVCLARKRRSILWVDPHLQWRSSAVRHLLHSLPRLKADGWNIRAWCCASDVPDEVETTLLHCPRFLLPLESLWFFFAANTKRLWWKLLHGHSPAAIVHSTGSFYLGAEAVSVHFIDAIWMRKQVELGFDSLKDFIRLLLTILNTAADYLQFNHREVRVFLPVSNSIGEAVKARCRASAMVEVFPNSYDETRFNPEVRIRYREKMRRALNLENNQFAFLFVSQGHYKRKGFWLAVKALQTLRSAGRQNLRFIVVGGSPASLDLLKQQLSLEIPDWMEWIQFAGPQLNVEHYYAAGDAFLFPSYFEAFCLAEIEAAVCGLPLLLTPHPGSEMILKDGVNGKLLSFDPKEMAVEIASFIDKGLPEFTPGAGQGLNRAQYAGKLGAFYQRVLELP